MHTIYTIPFTGQKLGTTAKFVSLLNCLLIIQNYDIQVRYNN